MNRKEIGFLNEKKAQQIIQEKGYEILDTNFSCPYGEIDIICRDGDCIVFIEVRSKKNPNFGLPEETVTPVKQKKIVKTAQYYLSINNVDFEQVRFDVVSILGNKIKHIKSAFEV